jgi:hypothetical protein
MKIEDDAEMIMRQGIEVFKTINQGILSNEPALAATMLPIMFVCCIQAVMKAHDMEHHEEVERLLSIIAGSKSGERS